MSSSPSVAIVWLKMSRAPSRCSAGAPRGRPAARRAGSEPVRPAPARPAPAVPVAHGQASVGARSRSGASSRAGCSFAIPTPSALALLPSSARPQLASTCGASSRRGRPASADWVCHLCEEMIEQPCDKHVSCMAHKWCYNKRRVLGKAAKKNAKVI